MAASSPSPRPQPPVALITGGARRVGRAVALHLARHGWDIAITYHTSRDEAADLARQVEGLGREALTIEADLTRPEQSSRAICEAFGRRFGRLNLLMHNASVYEEGDVWSVDAQTLRDMFAIHAEAPLLLTRGLAPLLRAAGEANAASDAGHAREAADEAGAAGAKETAAIGATVIAMTDLNVDRPRPFYAAYCMSKAALANLVPILARELAPDVTVNAIAPGVVAWPEDMPEEERRQYLARVPLGRAGTPGDVARLIHFLATEGRYITGQTIRLDGGRSVR